MLSKIGRCKKNEIVSILMFGTQIPYKSFILIESVLKFVKKYRFNTKSNCFYLIFG